MQDRDTEISQTLDATSIDESARQARKLVRAGAYIVVIGVYALGVWLIRNPTVHLLSDRNWPASTFLILVEMAGLLTILALSDGP